MNCENAILLVEKLADGEASAAETVLVEQHVATCADCRSHHAFVKALAGASEKFELPQEPPQAYWDHLPSRIVARLHEDESTGFWQRLFAPSVLRWGALAATLMVAVAVGVNVVRQGELDVVELAPDKLIPADIARTLEAPEKEVEVVERVPAESPQAPGVSTPAPATARDEALLSRRLEDAPSGAIDPERLRERPATASRARAKREADAAPASSLRAERENASEPPGVERESNEPFAVMESVTLEPVPSLASGEAGADPADREYQELRRELRPGVSGGRASAVTVEDCASWRSYLERYPDGSRATDVRYELALCGLRRYEADPSDAVRDVAIRDADAFLTVESEGPRAEEIRERAASLRD